MEFGTAGIKTDRNLGVYTNCFEGGLFYYSQQIIKHFGLSPKYLSICKGKRPTHPEHFPMSKITYDVPLARWINTSGLETIIAFEGSTHVGNVCRQVPRKINIVNWEIVKTNWTPTWHVWDELWFPTQKTAELYGKTHKNIKIMRGINWAPDIHPFPKPQDGIIRIYHNCGTVGVHGRKNPRGVVEAYNVLLNKYPNLKKTTRLIISSQRKITLPGIDHPNIKVHRGTLTRKEIIHLYNIADIVIQPSKREGFGVPLYEALAAKCLLVTTNAAPMNEVPQNGDVFLIPVDSFTSVKKSFVPLANTKPIAIAKVLMNAISTAMIKLR